MNTYKDEVWLYHHGVKGQQWGVRRGPPYPIEDTVRKVRQEEIMRNIVDVRDELTKKGKSLSY